MAYFDKYGVEFSDDRKTLVKCPESFQGEYAIPNGVTDIGDDAFFACSGLTAVTIPDCVTRIGLNAFHECEGLSSVIISNGVSEIEDCAFGYCSNLISIKIGNAVTYIGDGAFDGCISVTSVVVAKENSVYDSREDCNAIIKSSSNTLIAGFQSTFIPNSVKEIGEGAFWGCSSLKAITIPDSVVSIGDSAFRACEGLLSLNIPNSVRLIEDWAFCDCNGLKEVTIGNSIVGIGDHVFCDCGSLMSIIIPDRDDIERVVKRVVGDKIKIIRNNSQYANSSTSVGDTSMKECTKCKKMCIIPVNAIFCPEYGTKL